MSTYNNRALLANRIIKFAVVGATGVLINTAALYLGHDVAHLPLVVASVIAVEMAILNNFVLNNAWTFGQRNFALERLFQFHLVSLGGLVITVVVLTGLVQLFGLYYLIANLVAIGFATAWNFVANSLWTWSGTL